MNKFIASFLLVGLMGVFNPSEVSALSERVDNVPVPIDVSLNVQNIYQGYIIYSIEEVGDTYVCILARDGEPHQFPIRTVTFSSDWRILRDSGYKTPKVEPKPEPVTPPPVDVPETIEEVPPADPVPEIESSPVTPTPIPVTPVPDQTEEPSEEIIESEQTEPEEPEEPPVLPKPEEPEEELEEEL